MFHRFGQSKTREILKRGKRDASATKKKNRRGQNRDDLERPRDSNRINPVNIEESHPFGISLLSSTRPPLPSLSPPIPIGCSVEMPSRNHPSRLIESLTLMNIGSDRRARGTLFSPCLFPLPSPVSQANGIPHLVVDADFLHARSLV